MGIVVGIDATRNRSGGAVDHMIGLLSSFDPSSHDISKIHIWSYKQLLDDLPDVEWLVKHCPRELSGHIFGQLWWQYRTLPKELSLSRCDVFFASDAGSMCRFRPMVVLSQDALSFEPGIMRKFGITRQRLRLVALRFVQVRSMRSADGVIFLTTYVCKLIQRATGTLYNHVVIPHGIDEPFHHLNAAVWTKTASESIVCVYVSNASFYKNQWFVIRAISDLRSLGYNLKLALVGGSSGHAVSKVKDEIESIDPNRTFVELVDFVPHEYLPEILKAAHIFVFASSCETIAITLLEGMAAGLPIACSNRGPMPEVLQEGGVYFDPEDSQSIASAIQKIITDDDLREAISIRAKELSSVYTWKKCASRTFAFLESVVKD